MTPHRVLRDRVASIAEIDSDGGARTVLPTGGAVLGLQFRGRIDAEEAPLSRFGVTGIQDRARRYAYAPQTGTILVRFTLQGVTCLGVPADQLRGRHVALHDVLPAASVHELLTRVEEAPGPQARIALVERWLLGLAYAHDPVVERAGELLTTSGDDGGVAGVARALGLSERQLERRFRARVGVSPKRYARLRRFERAMALLDGPATLTEVAYAAGYYDQSHFIREVRAFAGRAPGALVSDLSKR